LATMRGLGGATHPREPHGGLGLARWTMEAANRAVTASSPARLGPSGDGAPGVGWGPKGGGGGLNRAGRTSWRAGHA
jgi:hypothetical protein